MPTNKDLGQALRRLRQAHRLTLEALGFAAGIDPAYLSEIERGTRNPSWGKVCDLAQALGCPLHALVRAAETEAACRGERTLTPEEFDRHFGHLPTDGEG